MRRVLLLFGALAVAAAVGVLVARSRSGGDGSTRTDSSARPAVPMARDDPGPVAGDGTLGADLAAARSSAIRAVALTGDVVRAGFISRRVLIASFTTPVFGPTLADKTSQGVDAMLLELGERDVDTSKLAVVEQPLTATAETTTAGVRVRVWSVLVIAAPGAGPGRQVWRTVTVDMVDMAGRWLVDGWSSTPGPTPTPPAAGSFDDASAFVEPLAWPAATAATGEG
jgi:hypothetical protein